MTADPVAAPASEPPASEPPPQGPREARSGRWTWPRIRHAWPPLLLAGWTIAVWGRPVLGDFADRRLSNAGDSESFAYYLAWNVHALTHGRDPFFTPNLYAPDGLDLGNAISMPYVAILVAPVTAVFGGTAGYNAAFLLSIFLTGFAVYLLARELYGSTIGATLAAALVIVSPYFTGHALGHLNLMWVFGLPFLAYLVARFVRGRLRRRWLVILVALTVAVTIGASTELFVTQTVFAVVALVVAAVVATPTIRRRILSSVPWLFAGGVGGVVLAGPVIVAGLRSGIPEDVFNPPEFYPTELTNVLTPTGLHLIPEGVFEHLRSEWMGNDAENTAYLPIPLLLLVTAVVVLRRRRATVGLAAFAGIALLCSLGPFLTIAGQPSVRLPWSLATGLPGLDHALPARFSAFVFMALALLVAEAWAAGVPPRWLVGAAALASSVLLLPNLSVMTFPVDASVPAFVTSGGLEKELDEGENVLILPPGQWGPGMRWMDELDFSFRMPAGNGGGALPPPALDEPLGAALFRQDLAYPYEKELLTYLEDVDVDTVIVDSRHPEWKGVMDRVLPGAAESRNGAWVYHLP